MSNPPSVTLLVPPHRHWRLWVAVLLLWVLFAQVAGAAARTSLTIDEGLHITSGYSIWRTGDYRLVEEHPPLAKLISTWPLLLAPDLPSPANSPGWGEGNLVRVMKHWLQPYRPFERLVSASRVSIMLLALVLGAAVFRWASDLAGGNAGLIALGIYTFDPNILAHGTVAATDLATAAFMFFATYTFWRALRRPTRAKVVLAGAMLGLAQATKISAAILVPLYILLAGLTLWRRVSRPRLAQLGWLMVMIFALAGVTLWAIYGFELRTPPGWSIPLPAASHLIPLQRVHTDLAAGRTTFLMGQYSEQGWWYYFPLAFAIKTPIPTLLLLAASIVTSIFALPTSKAAGEPSWWDTLTLIAFPFIYSAVALTQSFNIGYRHLLPILPFLFVFIGNQISNLKSQYAVYILRFTFYILLLWYIIGAARIFPHHLAYFNELVGGPDGGYHYLVDSNLDWGQGWKELKSYMDTHGIERIKFAQFSSNDPATYGIDYEPIAPMDGAPPVLPSRFNPDPGVYVLSASSLQGVPLADVNTYDYFRHRQPTARIGHALFVYNVQPLNPPPDWVASCAAPAPSLEPPDIAAGFGRNNLRLVYFDCQQAWVWPGSSVQGWTILPYVITHDQNTFAQHWLEHSQLTFEQKQSFALPPHSIFLSAGGNTPPAIQDLVPISATIGNTAELLGYTLNSTMARPGQTIELLTLWRVIGPPPGALSVMAHLIAPDGRAAAVGDGLGFTAEQWQVGDVFAQRSLFALPPDAPAGSLEVQIGMYTLADVQRLDILQNGVIIGDSLRLASVDVKP